MGSVILALPKIEDSRRISGYLQRYGIEPFAICRAGAGALSKAYQLESGVIICSHRLADMSAEDLAGRLPENFEILLLTAREMQDDCPSGAVPLLFPCKVSELVRAVRTILERRDRRIREERAANRKRRHTETEQNYINNAKAMLMQKRDMTEPEAFRYIQKTSMDTGRSMVETAQMILRLGMQF